MAFSRTEPRHDIAYLRRRAKIGEVPPAPSPPAQGSSLSLGRRPAEASPAPSARRVRGRAVLSRDAPTVTLDRRQSAIGSLKFELVGSGELSCAWELVDGEAGLVSKSAGVVVSPEFGRRPIVQIVSRSVIVGLRHVRELRRLLLIGAGLPNTTTSRLVGDLLDGGTIESAHTGVQPVIVALAAYQVDGELVLRREDAGFSSLEKAAAAYGFALTWLPPLER